MFFFCIDVHRTIQIERQQWIQTIVWLTENWHLWLHAIHVQKILLRRNFQVFESSKSRYVPSFSRPIRDQTISIWYEEVRTLQENHQTGKLSHALVLGERWCCRLWFIDLWSRHWKIIKILAFSFEYTFIHKRKWKDVGWFYHKHYIYNRLIKWFQIMIYFQCLEFQNVLEKLLYMEHLNSNRSNLTSKSYSPRNFLFLSKIIQSIDLDENM